MTDQLDAFLASGTPPEGAPEPPAPAEPESGPTPPEASPGAAETQAKGAEPDAEDDAPPHSGSDTRTVPLATLEKVRNDWKSKHAAEQARAELLAKQLEEAKKQPPAPPPQPMFVPPPDPNQDPAGFMQHLVVQNQKAMLNERLNTSEAMARERLGDEKLDAYVNDFKTAAESDPSLWGKLYSQPHPYGWLTRQMDTWRMHKEIGDNPDAYRQRIVAEERAKWEQEVASSRGAPVSPAANLPPSLANVRSVAGRTTSTFTGPPPLEDLFPGHNRLPQRR